VRFAKNLCVTKKNHVTKLREGGTKRIRIKIFFSNPVPQSGGGGNNLLKKKPPEANRKYGEAEHEKNTNIFIFCLTLIFFICKVISEKLNYSYSFLYLVLCLSFCV